MPRIRRPLLALIVLIIALAVGYGIKAAESDHAPLGPPHDSLSTTTSLPTSGP